MVNITIRIIRRVSRQKGLGFATLIFLLVLIVVGNALTFFFFERVVDSTITIGDSFWYSVVSISTIGYGDIFPTTAGARLGTLLFIVILGLGAFTSVIGVGIEWILDRNYRKRAGMRKITSKNHVLIVNFPNERRVRQIIDEFLSDPDHKNDEIIVITDQISALPFDDHNVNLVRGSSLSEETHLRANATEARQAIILSTGYDDPNSDSVAASIATILSYLNPNIAIVAEVLDSRHSLLFRTARNTSLVYTFRMSNNLLVQEAQDPGVSTLTQAIVSNQVAGTLASTKVEGVWKPAPWYKDVAANLLEHDINLAGVIRDEEVHLRFEDIRMTENDLLVYICSIRHTWHTIYPLLKQ